MRLHEPDDTKNSRQRPTVCRAAGPGLLRLPASMFQWPEHCCQSMSKQARFLTSSCLLHSKCTEAGGLQLQSPIKTSQFTRPLPASCLTSSDSTSSTCLVRKLSQVWAPLQETLSDEPVDGGRRRLRPKGPSRNVAGCSELTASC